MKASAPRSERVRNFSAGPAGLPETVRERVAEEILDYRGTGLSVMEMSHRSAEFEGIIRGAEARMRELLGLGEEWAVLFLQGGASLQFTQLAMSFGQDPAASGALPGVYEVTGEWGRKALAAAGVLDTPLPVAGFEGGPEYRAIPASLPGVEGAYRHVTTNETIGGVQYPAGFFDGYGGPPLVADASSDLLSRPLDMSPFAMVYAGAQKNLGIAGLTFVLLRRDFMETGRAISPMLDYRTFDKAGSLYNTPPCFAVYVAGLVLDWIAEQGLDALGATNAEKARTVYAALDAAPLYAVHPVREARSEMNVVFRLSTPELEVELLKEARAQGMIELQGHRSVGGTAREPLQRGADGGRPGPRRPPDRLRAEEGVILQRARAPVGEALRALRRSLRPLLAIQLVTFAVAALYALSPAFQRSLEGVARLRDAGGLPFAALATVIASVVLPEIAGKATGAPDRARLAPPRAPVRRALRIHGGARLHTPVLPRRGRRDGDGGRHGAPEGRAGYVRLLAVSLDADLPHRVPLPRRGLLAGRHARGGAPGRVGLALRADARDLLALLDARPVRGVRGAGVAPVRALPLRPGLVGDPHARRRDQGRPHIVRPEP